MDLTKTLTSTITVGCIQVKVCQFNFYSCDVIALIQKFNLSIRQMAKLRIITR